jgi:hypothetical protein
MINLDPIIIPNPISISMIMILDNFPSLYQTQIIKEFDDSLEYLSNFIISIEYHLIIYNIPLSQGGYISGNMDDDWIFINHQEYIVYPIDSYLNYIYDTRFYLLLDEYLINIIRD